MLVTSNRCDPAWAPNATSPFATHKAATTINVFFMTPLRQTACSLAFGLATADGEIATHIDGRFRRNTDDTNIVLDADLRAERLRVFLQPLENRPRQLRRGRLGNVLPRPWS